MTPDEKKLALENIRAYENMIRYLQKQIDTIQAKMQDKCCFEKQVKHELKIKRTK